MYDARASKRNYLNEVGFKDFSDEAENSEILKRAKEEFNKYIEGWGCRTKNYFVHK